MTQNMYESPRIQGQAQTLLSSQIHKRRVIADQSSKMYKTKYIPNTKITRYLKQSKTKLTKSAIRQTSCNPEFPDFGFEDDKNLNTMYFNQTP